MSDSRPSDPQSQAAAGPGHQKDAVSPIPPAQSVLLYPAGRVAGAR